MSRFFNSLKNTFNLNLKVFMKRFLQKHYFRNNQFINSEFIYTSFTSAVIFLLCHSAALLFLSSDSNSILRTLNSSLCTQYSALRTHYSELITLNSSLCTPHSSLCTLKLFKWRAVMEQTNQQLSRSAPVSG